MQKKLAGVNILISVLLTGILFLWAEKLPLRPEQTLAIGQSLTMVLFAVGIVSHFQSRKGMVHPFLFPLMGMVPGAYALCRGSLRHVASYQVLVLVIHGFIMWNQWKHARTAGDVNPDNQEPLA